MVTGRHLKIRNNSTREMNKQTSEQEKSRKFFGDRKPHGTVFFLIYGLSTDRRLEFENNGTRKKEEKEKAGK